MFQLKISADPGGLHYSVVDRGSYPTRIGPSIGQPTVPRCRQSMPSTGCYDSRTDGKPRYPLPGSFSPSNGFPPTDPLLGWLAGFFLPNIKQLPMKI
jgi:hypothetical protein